MFRSLALVIWILFHSALAAAADLGTVWERLDKWDGPRHVLLRAKLPDPYASQTYRRLVNGLVDRGYTVIPETGEETAKRDRQGLSIELVQTDSGEIVAAVIDVAGGTLLLVAEIGDDRQTLPLPSAGENLSDGNNRHRAAPSHDLTTVETERPERVTLAGRPKRLAVLNSGQESGYSLALLHDDHLEWLYVARGQVISSVQAGSNISASRALFLDAGNIDTDPQIELVAVWGQDRDRIGRGTSTAIFGRVFELQGDRLLPESPVIEAYLRIINDAVFAQRRSAFSAYMPGILRWRSGDAALTAADSVPYIFQNSDLYDVSPFTSGSYLKWTQRDTLRVIDVSANQPSLYGETPGLGSVEHPVIAVRLREPVIVGDPSPTMQRKERLLPLPRRVIKDSTGSAYTIERRRRFGVLGFLGSTGNDHVIEIGLKTLDLRIEKPYPPVNDYILDFGIIKRSENKPEVVALVNEDANGSGQAALLWQRAATE